MDWHLIQWNLSYVRVGRALVCEDLEEVVHGLRSTAGERGEMEMSEESILGLRLCGMPSFGKQIKHALWSSKLSSLVMRCFPDLVYLDVSS